MTPSTPPKGIEQLVEREVSALSPDLRAQWMSISVAPALLTSDVVLLARRDSRVLGYDAAEEEFGTGELDRAGKLRDWGTWGERLAWALPHL
jgi:hypothetical protein